VKDAARLAVAAGAGALAARGAYAALRRYPPAGEQTWSRTNHRGEAVTLLEGPALTAGAVAGTFAAAARPAARGDLAAAVAGLGAAAFGALDDLRGSAKRRGLRGHLGALAHGEVTTGAVKLAGLAATGLAAALVEGGDPVDVAVNAGLIAAGANLLNLFDLRPGRAIKVATLGAAALAAGGALAPGARAAGGAAVAAPLGAALALLAEDLGERAMLGDSGANALGAMLGAAAARTLPRGARAGLLGGIVALTLTSEKVSFTKVIAATPPLNWLDMLGRRPAGPPPQPAPVPGDAPGDQGDPPGQVPARDRRYRRGRHRRTETGETRSRSGSWFAVFLKTVTRREP
jgi:UDP-GlcNAc:undecaprenyl-phosphate GlcNAc-1-phosphate transferase